MCIRDRYIDYAYMLNSFENLVGNILVFVPFGFLLPYVWKKAGSFWVMLLNAVIFVLGIEVFQLFSAFGAFDAVSYTHLDVYKRQK